jgi:ABC-type dipeptide/oligopeptide/nickel transport system permease subunit
MPVEVAASPASEGLAPLVAPPRSRRWNAARAVWGPVEGKIGIAILAVFAFVVAFGPALAPYGLNEIGVAAPNASPEPGLWLGTDSLGRDVFSRLLIGGRSVIVIPVLATLLAFMIGGTAGMVAGYRGGKVGAVIGRVTDILISLPYLLVVLVVVTTLNASTGVLIVAVALVFAPRIARVLRGATHALSVREFVQAAQARGERTSAILGYELLPNILPTVMVEFAARLTDAIIFVATLNDLGLGLQPPSSNWAVMVADSKETITTAPLQTIAPALAIGALSLGVSLIADSITQSVGRTQEGTSL